MERQSVVDDGLVDRQHGGAVGVVAHGLRIAQGTRLTRPGLGLHQVSYKNLLGLRALPKASWMPRSRI